MASRAFCFLTQSAAKSKCGLAAIVDPVARPRGGVSQRLRFVVEIVERVEIVRNRIGVQGAASDEHEVGRKPAVR